MVNWNDAGVKDRLIAAIIGSLDHNVSCREIARLYGQDATTSAIENFLRKPKKEALALKAEATGKTAPAASPAKPRTPKKNNGGNVLGVKDARVTKSPRKQNGAQKSSTVKKEVQDFDRDVTTSGGEAEGDAQDADYA